MALIYFIIELLRNCPPSIGLVINMSGGIYEIWPVDFLEVQDVDSKSHVDAGAALIILNQPIADITLLSRLWKHTTYRLCADGGANRLYDIFHTDEDRRKHFVGRRVLSP